MSLRGIGSQPKSGYVRRRLTAFCSGDCKVDAMTKDERSAQVEKQDEARNSEICRILKLSTAQMKTILAQWKQATKGVQHTEAKAKCTARRLTNDIKNFCSKCRELDDNLSIGSIHEKEPENDYCWLDGQFYEINYLKQLFRRFNNCEQEIGEPIPIHFCHSDIRFCLDDGRYAMYAKYPLGVDVCDSLITEIHQRVDELYSTYKHIYDVVHDIESDKENRLKPYINKVAFNERLKKSIALERLVCEDGGLMKLANLNDDASENPEPADGPPANNEVPQEKEIEIDLAKISNGKSKTLLTELLLTPGGIQYNPKKHGAKQPGNLKEALERNNFIEAARIIYKPKNTNTIKIKEGFVLKAKNNRV